jgi:hypothetical protein
MEKALLEMLTREEFDLAFGALEKLQQRADDLENQWQKRIEAAEYEADKAARRYYRVEPENRLVARTLESEWNLKLEEVEGLKKEYEKARNKLPFEINQQQRKKIMELAYDLPRLWKEATTPNSKRKQILRILIKDVTLQNQDVPWSVAVAIRWQTGFVSRYQAERVHPHPHTTDSKVIDRIKQLYTSCIDREIAEILNNEGYRSGYGNLFTQNRITRLRNRQGLRKQRSLKNHE